MRYWNTTNRIKKAFALVGGLICFSMGSAYAQLGLLSPYSSLGVGVEVTQLNARTMGMGGINIGLSGPRNVSPLNPASYCMGVDTMSVMFNVGFSLNTNALKQNLNGKTVQNYSIGGGLSNLEFYFPLFKWWKMGLYLIPYTDVAYRASNFRVNDPNIGETQLTHQGVGGLNRFGWGNSFGWGPVAVGINLNYQFGNVEETSSLVFKDDSLASDAASSRTVRSTRLDGLAIDVGLLYSQRIGRGRLTVGASYSLAANMHSKRYTIGTAYYSASSFDTAFYKERKAGTVVVPGKLRVGLSYENNTDWLVGVDFTYAWWSDYSDFGKKYDYFKNTYTIAVGAELKNNYQSASAMRRVAYRLGGRYGTFYTDFDGKNMAGFAINLGVGIPVRGTRSMINIGLEYGKAGNEKKGQIREDCFKLGVSFSSVETWFVKRKYD